MNVDFADVRTVMRETGDALMGVGIGSGENKAVGIFLHAPGLGACVMV